MTKYAVVLGDNTLADVVSVDPSIIFTPEYAATFVEVSDDAESGWLIDSAGNVSAPVIAAAEVEPNGRRLMFEADFLATLQRSERIAVKSARATDSDLDDFMTMLEKTGFVDLSSSGAVADLSAFVAAEYLAQSTVDALLG